MFAELCARMFSKTPATFQVVRWFPFAAGDLEDVASDMNLIEGPVRYRKRKKWKSRWAVLRRVNPAADVLDLILYQDQVSARARQKEKAFISLQTFAGLQLLNKLDKHYNVIITVTANEVIPLSFETIEQRAEWVSQFQRHFGQEQSFQGIIPRHKQKIKSGEATLRFYRSFFTLTRKDNYKFLGRWNLVDLPHYGAVDGGFAFQVKDETTSRGLPSIYYFATRQGREIHQLFDGVCRGIEVPAENSYVDPAGAPPKRSESQSEGVSRPNFFKRTWQRISKRGPRRPRPRSRSEPSDTRRHRRRDENTASQLANRELPSVPNENITKERNTSEKEIAKNTTTTKASTTSSEHPLTPDGYEVMNDNADDVFSARKTPEKEVDKDAKTTKPSATSSEHPLTPEGYELMKDNDDDIVSASTARASRSSEGSAGRHSLNQQPEKEQTVAPIDEGVTDQDGYELVDEMDVEEIVREAERRIEEERKREEQQQREEEEKAKAMNAKSTPIADEKKEETKAEQDVSSDTKKGEKIGEEKTTVDEKEDTNINGKDKGNLASEDATDGKSKWNDSKDEKLVNGDVFNAVDHEKCDVKNGEGSSKDKTEKEKSSPTRSPKKSPKKTETEPKSPVREVPKGRRGHKNPPPELVLPDGDGSPDNPYVNSPPRTADYVNVPGSKLKILRDRSRTTPSKPPGLKLKKQHQYDMYDGNDDSIYHSVESLMPGHPAYQNLQYEGNRSHSFENLPGHSYTNVPGQLGVQAYQNIGPPGTQAYVNINSTPKRKFQRNPNTHNLNYIRVEGTSGNHGPPILTSPVDQSAGMKSSSDYTWIDESKTRLLKETARLHSDLRKENLPKVQTKKY